MTKLLHRRAPMGQSGGGGFALNNPFSGVWAVIVLATLMIPLGIQIAVAADDLVVYDDALAAGWQDWSYNELCNPTAGSQPVFYIDTIRFTGSGAAPLPPELAIDTKSDVHPISPYIYGMNFASTDVAAAVRLPVRRWGGNSTSRYNWQLDVHNTGADWYFENIPDEPGRIHNTVLQNMDTGSETILTMPLIGWTPKGRQEGHPYDCGFKVSIYGLQDAVDPWDTDCGNGLQSGIELTGNDPTDTSQAITPAFVSAWIDDLTAKFGTASGGGVTFYSLDNEPMLWNHTHRDVHPAAVTYDEIRDRTYAYAAAIKNADTGAFTLGPVAWGWCAYFYSAADGTALPGHETGHHRIQLGGARIYERGPGPGGYSGHIRA